MATYDQLRDALRRAHRAGDTRAAQRFAQRIKDQDYEEESSPLASVLQGLGQGATLGFADELAAGIRAGAERFVNPAIYAVSRKFAPYPGQEDKPFTELFREHQEQFYGEPIGTRFREALESQREAVETARREDPYTTGVAELAGGLGTGGVGLARAAAPTLGRTALRMAPGAAVLGAASAVGYSEADPLSTLAFGEPGEWKDELAKAGGEAAVGGTIGGVLGAATPVIGAGLRGITRFVTNPFTKKARLTEDARQQVMQALQDDIDQGYIGSLDELKRDIGELGLSVADAGPMTRQLTERLAQTPTAGARAVEDFFTTRNKEQFKRVMPRLAQALDADDNFEGAIKQLVSDRTANANRAYDRAYEIPVRLTQEMQDIIANPEFRRAIRTANRIRRARGLTEIPDAPRIGTQMQTQELDHILQGMDDAVSRDFKTSPAVARQVTKPLRDEFRGMVYDANPALRDARAQWSGDMLNEEAANKGLNIFRQDADFIAEEFRDMGPSEQMFYKIGVLRAIKRKLGNKSDTSDIVKGIFDNPNRRDAVRTAFGGDEQFNNFMRYIEGEQRKFETFKQATQNSATAKRILQQETDPGRTFASVLGFGTTGSLLVGGAAGRLYGALAPSARRAARQEQIIGRQAPMLTSADPAMIDQLQRGTTLGGLLATGGQPSVGVGLGGLLSTSQIPEMISE